MSPESKLGLTQNQRLVLIPALKQVLKIFQLPLLELRENINQELLENPFLEEVESTDEYAAIENTTEVTDSKENEDSYDIGGLTYEDWKNYFESGPERSDSQYGYYDDSKEYDFDNIITKEPTLYEFLLEQLRLATNDTEEYRIGEIIIGNIDENGYLSTPIEEIANGIDNVEIAKVERVLELIQTFDPVGVGARNLRECLLIQIKEKEHPLALKILIEHWDDFEKRHYNNIAKALGLTIEEAQKACSYILKLEPKPCRNFGSSSETRIIPDIIVDKIDEKYIIRVNDDGLPRLGINKFYNTLLNRDTNPGTKEYIKEKLQQAYNIIKGIEERRKNLLKISRIIVDIQKDFLDNGIEYLKPLILNDVANKSGLHESTVSRLTSNKYIQTPFGFIPFKLFFSNKISKEDGLSLSSSSIKEMIRELIVSEDTVNPMSDKKIMGVLANKGMKLARRTIAKYREEMNIPASNFRVNHGVRSQFSTKYC